MNKQLFQDYANLEAQIKQAKEQQDEIKIQLLDEMKIDEVDKVQADFGTFSLIKRSLYKYTSEFTEKITQLKEEIKETETEGKETAEKTVLESLRFQVKK